MSNTNRSAMSEQAIRNSVRKIISEQKVMKAQRDYLTEGMRLVALYQIAEKKLGNAKSSKLISEAVVSGVKDPFTQNMPGFRRDPSGSTFKKDKAAADVKKTILSAAQKMGTQIASSDPAEIVKQLIELSKGETTTDQRMKYDSATAQLLRILNTATVLGAVDTLESTSGMDVKNIYNAVQVDPAVKAKVNKEVEEIIKAGEKPESAISKVGKSIAGGLKSAASWFGLGGVGAGPEKISGKTAGVLTPEFSSKLQDPKTKAAAIAELEALLGSMK